MTDWRWAWRFMCRLVEIHGELLLSPAVVEMEARQHKHLDPVAYADRIADQWREQM